MFLAVSSNSGSVQWNGRSWKIQLRWSSHGADRAPAATCEESQSISKLHSIPRTSRVVRLLSNSTYLPLATGHGNVDETAGVLETLHGAALGLLLLLLCLDLQLSNIDQHLTPIKNHRYIASEIPHSPPFCRRPPNYPLAPSVATSRPTHLISFRSQITAKHQRKKE